MSNDIQVPKLSNEETDHYHFLFNCFYICNEVRAFSPRLWEMRTALPRCWSLTTLLLSRSVVPTLRPRGLQHPRLPSITISQSMLRLTSTESVILASHLILCRPLLLLPSIFPSIRVFSNESTLRMRWPKYWRFSFSIIPSKEHPGLISFRMDWLDLLAVQGTLKSLLQHHSSKASILWRSAYAGQRKTTWDSQKREGKF